MDLSCSRSLRQSKLFLTGSCSMDIGCSSMMTVNTKLICQTYEDYKGGLRCLLKRSQRSYTDFMTPTKINASGESKRRKSSNDYRINSSYQKNKSTNSTRRSWSCRSHAIASITGGRGCKTSLYLDALLAKRILEEEELLEQQKKRKPEVQEAAQYYT
ncbi:hypothetical protein Tco_0612725 [Tanacetum coccineum]